MRFLRRHKLAAITVVLVLLGYLSVRAATSETSLRFMVDSIGEQLKSELGLTLAIQKLDVDASDAQLVAQGVVVTDQDGFTLFSARRIFVELSPLQFFAKRLNVAALEIDDPLVHVRIKDGRIVGMKAIEVPKGDASSGPLFRVDVGDFRVRNGTLKVDVDDKVQTTFSGIKSRLRSSGPDGHRLKFSVESGEAVRPGDLIVIDRFSGRMTVFGDGLLAPERVSLSEITLNSEESSVSVGGSILLGQLDLVPAFDVDLNATASLPALLSHVELPVEVKGAVSVGAHISAGFGGTDFQAVGQGDIADLVVHDFWVGTLRGQFHADEEEVVVPSATWEYADTVLTGNGSVKLSDETLPFDVDVSFDRFSLYKMMEHLQVPGSWVEMLATGHVTGSGVVLPDFRFEGAGRGHFHDLVVQLDDAWKVRDEKPVLEDPNDIDVDVTFLADMEHVYVKGIIDDNYTRADGHLTLWFDLDKGFEVVATSERAGFGSIGGRIANLDFTGDGFSTLTIRGPYTGPRIDADTTIRGFSLDGYDFGNMNGHISYDDGVLTFGDLVGNVGSSKYTGTVALDWFRKMQLERWHDAAGKRIPAEKVAYEGLHIDADIDVPRGMLQELRSVIPGYLDEDGVLGFFRDIEAEGPVTGHVVARGYMGDGTIEQITAEGEIQIGAGARLLGQTLKGGGGPIRMPLKTVQLDDFKLDLAGGTLVANAEIWRDDGELNGDLLARNLALAGLDSLEGTEDPFHGTFDVTAQLSNFAQDPTLTGDFKLKDAAWGDIPIGDADMKMVHASRTVTLTGDVMSGRGDGVVRVSTRSPFAYSASVKVAPGAARPLLPPDLLPENLSVKMGGLVDASGALSEFRSSRGTISLKPLVVTLEGIDFAASGDVLGHFRGAALTLDQLEVATARRDQISLRGLVSSEKIDLQASGRGDLWFVPSFTDWVLSSSGPFSFDVAVTGDFDHASMNGRGAVTGGRFDVWKFDPMLEDVNARLIFQGPNVIVDSLQMRVGGAPTRARGSIQLAGFSPAAYDLVVDYSDLKLKIPEWLPTRSSGRLTVTGPAAFPTLAGEVQLLQASYTDTVNWERLLPDLRSKVSTPLVFDKAEEDVRLDLHLVADNGIIIDNNVVDLEAKGDLYLVGTEERPGLKGNVSLLRGSASFRNNRYQLTRGTVEFVDTYEISPVFDLEAETRVKDYDISAQISGGLSDLRIQFDSQPELAEIDIIALLTFGFTQFELRDATGTVGAGALEVVSAYSGLDEEVRRIVPQAVRDIDWLTMDELRLTSQFSPRQGTNVPAVAVGFEVNAPFSFVDGSHLRLQTTLFDDQGQQQQRVELEKRFENNLRLRLSWNSHDEALCQGCTTIGDPGLDLRYRFEY